MRKILIIMAVFALAFSQAQLSADILFFNDGEEVVGQLKGISNKSISFEDLNGKLKSYEEKDISSILISKIRKDDHITNVASLTDPVALGIMAVKPDPSLFQDAQYATLCRLVDVEYLSENKVTMRTREIVKVLKEQGLNMANQSFYYFTDREKIELEYAHTYSPDGKVYHITDDAISDEALLLSSPEYAKIKKYKIALKKVDVGSIIDYSFSRTLEGVTEISPFSLLGVFGEREPVMHEELAVTFPENIKINAVLSQWDEAKAPKFYEKKEKGKVIKKWIFADPKGYVAEQDMLPRSRVFPTLTLYQPYDWKSTAKSLQQGYEAARPTPELLDDFIEKCELRASDTELEKASKIYDAINKEIREIEIGPQTMGSYLPVSANVTLTKNYGNGQAILALMHYAFERVGIRSYPGFAGSKRRRVTVRENSTLDVAGDPILKVIIDGKAYYTEGGSSYLPFGYLVTILQGADAVFFDLNKGEHFVEELPIYAYEWNCDTRSVYVKILENGTMEVNQTIMPKGPYESGYRRLKAYKQKEKQNYAERWVKVVHPNAILNEFSHSDLNDLMTPVAINITYTIPQAAQMATDKILTFTNFWTNYGASSVSLDKRKYPMRYWAQERVKKTVIYELPEGYEWVEWGKKYQHSSPEFTFNSGIYDTGRLLVYTDEFVANVDEMLTDEAYQNFRSCLLTMAELGNQWMIIEKTNKKAQEETDYLPDGEETDLESL
jgi:hypothetical protein